jgi:Protein of unknown function (DUF2911)
MLKKILIGLGVLLLAVVAFFVYGNLFPKSPKKIAEFSNAGLSVKVSYSQPFKKGRLIFGEEKDGALQPYGKYWRLGANAATEITLSKDVNFAGKPVKAGSYRMYAVPGATSFQISLNSGLGVFFGIAEPDYSLDVLKVDVPITSANNEVEQFTISFSEDNTAINMDFAWDKIIVRIPITQ